MSTEMESLRGLILGCITDDTQNDGKDLIPSSTLNESSDVSSTSFAQYQTTQENTDGESLQVQLDEDAMWYNENGFIFEKTEHIIGEIGGNNINMQQQAFNIVQSEEFESCVFFPYLATSEPEGGECQSINEDRPGQANENVNINSVKRTKGKKKVAKKTKDNKTDGRAKRKPVPEEAKDDKYWDMRKRNREATKRCRQRKATKDKEIFSNYEEMEKAIVKLEKKNMKLQRKIDRRDAQNSLLRERLSAIAAISGGEESFMKVEH